MIFSLQLTEEDRQELRRDRESAMKCEEMLARRKQEQHFDLVDKVKNVLRRIEVWKQIIFANDYLWLAIHDVQILNFQS